MKKSDLKTGHVVETRKGELYIVMLNHENHNGKDVLVADDGWLALYDYDENMKQVNEIYSYHDVIKVYSQRATRTSIIKSTLNCVWESETTKKEKLRKEIERIEKGVKRLRKEYDNM